MTCAFHIFLHFGQLLWRISVLSYKNTVLEMEEDWFTNILQYEVFIPSTVDAEPFR